MNTMQKTAVAALCLCAFTGVRADEQATRSRADVVAERQAARDSGWLAAMTGEDSGSSRLAAQHPGGAAASRAQVVAERDAARSAGEIAAASSECGPATPAPTNPLTRTAVVEALRAARAAGELQAYAGEDSGSSHEARQRDAQRVVFYAANGLGRP